MAKFIKILKIIGMSLLIVAGCSYAVLYIVNTELAKQIMDTIIDYANRPLPIVGVSATVLAVLVWKIFSSSKYGQNAINNLRKEYEKNLAEIKEEFEDKKTKYYAMLALFEEEIDLVLFCILEICSVSGNKKVREIGKRLEVDIEAIKNNIRLKFDDIFESNAKLLIEDKKQIAKEVAEIIKKELEVRYGKETKEVLESITEKI